MRTPLGWLEYLALFADPVWQAWERAARLPDAPITRFEYYEAMVFTKAKEKS